MDEQGMIKIGRRSGLSWKRWDEKGHAEIVRIFISHNEDEICSIQFQYMENGTLVLSQQHGQLSENYFDVIKFNHPEEYVTGVSGKTSAHSGDLSSLSIGTNLKTYGPFGKCNLNDKDFCYNLGKDREFGGFYGSILGGCVRSLGVYFKPVTTLDTENSDVPVIDKSGTEEF